MIYWKFEVWANAGYGTQFSYFNLWLKSDFDSMKWNRYLIIYYLEFLSIIAAESYSATVSRNCYSRSKLGRDKMGSRHRLL